MPRGRKAASGRVIYLVGGFVTTEYVHDRIYMIPAMIGAFLGTAGIITWKSKQEITK